MKPTLLAAALLGALGLPHAHAVSLGGDNLTITGFGTLAAARSDSDDARFVRAQQREGTAGTTTIGLDSNLGLQATYKLSDSVSATAQLLSRKRTGDSFTTELAWAFVKYKVSDEVSVRVGRVVLPSFLISEYQNVGYANTMMRPPVEMYGPNPLENIDGADVTWQHSFGETTVTTQAVAGITRGKLYSAADRSETRFHAPAGALAVTVEHGPVTVRGAYLTGKLKSDAVQLASLVGTLNRAGYAQLASDLDMHERKRLQFAEIGVLADWNDIVVQAEYGAKRAAGKMALPDSDAWYTMAGYRFGMVLPYYAHANVKTTPSVGVPASLAAVPALDAAVRGLLASSNQKTDTFGVRWDFASSAALKVQLDRVSPGPRAAYLIDVTPAGVGKKTTVIAAGVDFVF